LRIDQGSWFKINGTTSWSYSWNTNTVADGLHTLYVRSYDGEDYSEIQYVTIDISNPTGGIPGFTTGVAVVAATMGALVAFFRRRRI